MVEVPMRDDGEVELAEIDLRRFGVGREDGRIVSGIEEDALAGVFDQRAEAPILDEGGVAAEAIVEDRHPRSFGSGFARGDDCQQAQDRETDKERGHVHPRMWIAWTKLCQE